ncbi:MAG: DNA primase, partial [Mesorhizobium sp.]
PTLHRLYVIRDNDPAGDGARDTLIERATQAGIEAIVLSPAMEDFNEDLCHFGLATLSASIADQLMRRDRLRYLKRAA